jgi:hypothetical protein
MDDQTGWQDAALPADSQVIGPPKPEAATKDMADYDELESGIASILGAMQAAGLDGRGDIGADDEAAASLEDAHTFQLLGELDRLWQRPSP